MILAFLAKAIQPSKNDQRSSAKVQVIRRLLPAHLNSCLVAEPSSQVQLHELQELLKVGRYRPVPASVHVITERVQNGPSGGRRLIRTQIVLAEQPINRPGGDR